MSSVQRASIVYCEPPEKNVRIPVNDLSVWPLKAVGSNVGDSVASAWILPLVLPSETQSWNVLRAT